MKRVSLSTAALATLAVLVAACGVDAEEGSNVTVVRREGQAGAAGATASAGGGGAAGQGGASVQGGAQQGGGSQQGGAQQGGGSVQGGAQQGGSQQGGSQQGDGGAQGGASVQGGAQQGGAQQGGNGQAGGAQGGAQQGGSSVQGGAQQGGGSVQGGAQQGGSSQGGSGGEAQGGATSQAGAAGQGGQGGAAAGGEAGAGGAAQGGSSPCPVEMAYVTDGGFCVDRWEAQVEVLEGGSWVLHSPFETLDAVSAMSRAVSSPGVVPQGYISGVQARAACEGAGKRLCARTEYRTACMGPQMTTYPYGDAYTKGLCNEGRATHPIIDLFGSGPDVFNSTNMNDPQVNQLPDSLALTGSHPDCESGYGTFDMVGNLHEWVDEDEGTFCGGFYVDAEINGHGCLYTTTAHALGYHDYSTGFRCCLTP